MSKEKIGNLAFFESTETVGVIYQVESVKYNVPMKDSDFIFCASQKKQEAADLEMETTATTPAATTPASTTATTPTAKATTPAATPAKTPVTPAPESSGSALWWILGVVAVVGLGVGGFCIHKRHAAQKKDENLTDEKEPLNKKEGETA